MFKRFFSWLWKGVKYVSSQVCDLMRKVSGFFSSIKRVVKDTTMALYEYSVAIMSERQYIRQGILVCIIALAITVSLFAGFGALLLMFCIDMCMYSAKEMKSNEKADTNEVDSEFMDNLGFA